jgi:hypothetical protein
MNGKRRAGHSGTVLRLLLIALLAVGGSAGARPARAAEEGVTPDRIETTLDPGGCSEHTVTVTTADAPVVKADVVLVSDVTSSMSGVIREVQRGMDRIAADVREVVPDTAFGVATFADYPLVKLLADVPGADYPWRLEQGLTKDQMLLQGALDRITLVYGGDTEESYLRALFETQFLTWRPDARRLVILFGDSTPHEPDAGRDGDYGTADDLRQAEVIAQLKANNITVIGIYSEPSVRGFYDAVASNTGGVSFGLDRVDQVREAIRETVTTTVTRIHELTLAPDAAGAAWLSWEPATFADVPPATTREFAVRVCAPADAADGLHNFELQARGDAVTLGIVPVIVHVNARTPTPAPTDTPAATATPTETPIPMLPPPPPVAGFPWWVLIPLIGAMGVGAVLLFRRKEPTRGTVAPPRGRQSDGTSSGAAMQQKKADKSGSEVTHGKEPPRRRD